jgi:hypothetical protein
VPRGLTPRCFTEPNSNNDNSDDISEKRASLKPLQNVENISLSSVTVSKDFRMMTRQEIKNAVRQCHKYTVYKVSDYSEYHIIRGEYVIIVSVDQSNAEVITQMHKHKDYSLDIYIRAN